MEPTAEWVKKLQLTVQLALSVLVSLTTGTNQSVVSNVIQVNTLTQ
jgi:hypothetical protein